MESVEVDLYIEEINDQDYNIPTLYISPMPSCCISILCGSHAQIKTIDTHTTITFNDFHGSILLNGTKVITNTCRECTVIINGPHEYDRDMRIDSEE